MRPRPAFFALIVPFSLSGCENASLRACDAAIRATLKAPATYKRVSAHGDGILWHIEYDAANSFNVPLRAHGTCFYRENEKTASWIDETAMEKANEDTRLK